jgi:Outer membrane lipoprotein virB7
MNRAFKRTAPEWGTVLACVTILYSESFLKHPIPFLVPRPGTFLRFGVVLVTLSLLAGCTNPDPLAVATGALFPLNPGYWQPTPHDLAAPPRVTQN